MMESMTKPERVLATLKHQSVDRCAVLEQHYTWRNLYD